MGESQSVFGRMKAYTAVLVAAVALFEAGDSLYAVVRHSKMLSDAVLGIHKIIEARSPSSLPTFSIDLNGSILPNEPDDKVIATSVNNAACETNCWVILGRSDREFIQAAPEKDGWQLEYRAAQMETTGSKPILFNATGWCL